MTEWMTDEEILSTIDKALEDKQKLQDMLDPPSCHNCKHQKCNWATSPNKVNDPISAAKECHFYER